MPQSQSKLLILQIEYIGSGIKTQAKVVFKQIHKQANETHEEVLDGYEFEIDDLAFPKGAIPGDGDFAYSPPPSPPHAPKKSVSDVKKTGSKLVSEINSLTRKKKKSENMISKEKQELNSVMQILVYFNSPENKKERDQIMLP